MIAGLAQKRPLHSPKHTPSCAQGLVSELDKFGGEYGVAFTLLTDSNTLLKVKGTQSKSDSNTLLKVKVRKVKVTVIHFFGYSMNYEQLCFEVRTSEIEEMCQKVKGNPLLAKGNG